MRGVLGRRGQLEFSLEHFSVEIRLHQSLSEEGEGLDTGATVESMNVTLGPTHLTSNGIGAVTYILEMVFNVAPNVFRQRIADAAEYPLCQAIEDELQKLNIQALVQQKNNTSNNNLY